MTLANRQRLIDLHVDLFPAAKLVQMIDSATGDNPTMGYALARSPLIGIRGDCFGTRQFDTRMQEVNAVAPDRWKTAPIIVEYCGGEAGSGQMTRGKSQVVTHHVSLVEGNHDDYDDLSGRERRDFDETRKLAGYRLRLESLTVPNTMAAGSWVTVTSLWANDGSAPAYADWNVLLQLRDPETGSIAWQGRSSLDLRTLLPTTDPAVNAFVPVTIAESYPLDASLSPGAYEVTLTVLDPDGYYPSMALAMQGRGDDGSYRLGSIVVR